MLQITLTNRKTADSKVYKFTQNTVLLGRHQNCDIILDSTAISRRHAKITINKNLLEIEDLGSGNGTFLNKNKIPQNEKTNFTPDDKIRIEEFELSFSRLQQSKKPEIVLPSDSSLSTENNNESAKPDMLEMRMIKKVLGALDQDKLPSLTIVSGDFKDKKVFFDEGISELVVGREPECELSINSSILSRRHAVISIKWGSYVVTDLNSKNGTFVNGEKIKETSIKDGDEIVFGTIKAIFKNPQEFDINAISRSIEKEKAVNLEDTSSFDLKAIKQNTVAETEKSTSPAKDQSETPAPEASDKESDKIKKELEEKKTEEKKQAKDKQDKEDKKQSMDLDDLIEDKSARNPDKNNKTAKSNKSKFSFSELILFSFGTIVMLIVIAVLVYLFI